MLILRIPFLIAHVGPVLFFFSLFVNVPAGPKVPDLSTVGSPRLRPEKKEEKKTDKTYKYPSAINAHKVFPCFFLFTTGLIYVYKEDSSNLALLRTTYTLNVHVDAFTSLCVTPYHFSL